jgi:hypothetical protein
MGPRLPCVSFPKDDPNHYALYRLFIIARFCTPPFPVPSSRHRASGHHRRRRSADGYSLYALSVPVSAACGARPSQRRGPGDHALSPWRVCQAPDPEARPPLCVKARPKGSRSALTIQGKDFERAAPILSLLPKLPVRSAGQPVHCKCRKSAATIAQPAMPICCERGSPGRSHSCSFDHRRRPETLRTAMATAFF